MAETMSDDEITLLLLTLSPDEILKAYLVRAADLAKNIRTRWPERDAEEMLRAGLTACMQLRAGDGHSYGDYCAGRVRGAILNALLQIPVEERTLTTQSICLDPMLYELLSASQIPAACVPPLEKFRAALQGTPTSVTLALTCTDVLCAFRRASLPEDSQENTFDARQAFFEETLVSIYFGWCAL